MTKKKEDRYKFFLIVFISFFMVIFWQVLASYFWGDVLLTIDKWLNTFIPSTRNTFLNNLFLLITVAGNSLTIILASLIVGIVLLMSGRKKCFWILLVSNMAGIIFIGLSKYSIGRPRPPLENALIEVGGFSLPSGHSYFGMVFYGLLTYFALKRFSNVKKRIRIFLAGFGCIWLLGISRIYLGVHYLSDVLAGWATSGIWLSVVIYFLEKHKIYFSEKRADINFKNFLWLFWSSFGLVLVIQFIAIK